MPEACSLKPLLMILFTFALVGCGQSQSERAILGKAYAELELKETLADKTGHNVVDGKTLIVKDSLTAISVAEPILFGIYGQENIVKQRPYEVYLIDHYWVISGTLPKDQKGGTFLIIINGRDNSILKITHGK